MLLLVFVAGTAGTIWHLFTETERLYREFLLQGTTIETDTIKEFRKLYTLEVVDRVKRWGIEASHDPGSHERAIPLPATLTRQIGQSLGESRPGAGLRLFSEYPFPWQHDAGPRDPFEREVLHELRKNPAKPFYRFEEFEGRPSLRYAVADRMEAQCVTCHNVHMPAMDGFQATAAIRQREERTGQHISVIALTANAMKGDRERCLQGGFDDYLPKPVNPDQLFETIERLVAAAAAEV